MNCGSRWASCTNAIAGSPFITGADGTILVNGLQPGTYYAKELPGGNDYWVCDTSVKTVTVAVNQTAAVTFQNTQYGRIQFEKTTNTGDHLLRQNMERYKNCACQYSDTAVRQMIECIKVHHDGKLDIIFNGGYTITEQIEL